MNFYKSITAVAVLPILFLVTLLPGCAHWEVKKAKENIKVTCNSLIGCTEEEVVLAIGAPDKIEQISTLTIYHYHKSYGNCSNIFVGQYCGNAESYESFDKFDLIFKNGRVHSWKSNVQR